MDKEMRGRRLKGSQLYNAKLTEDDVREIRRRAADGETHTALAKEFKYARANITRMVHGQIWKHVE